MAGMSGPPLSGQSPTQAAGSSATGLSLPQALIQRRQQLTYKLRLCTLVILSRSAPQPAADDSAVAQPTTVVMISLVRAQERTSDTPSRPILFSRSTPHENVAPSRMKDRACTAGAELVEGIGARLTIKTGSQSPIGITRLTVQSRPAASASGPSRIWP